LVTDNDKKRSRGIKIAPNIFAWVLNAKQKKGKKRVTDERDPYRDITGSENWGKKNTRWLRRRKSKNFLQEEARKK